MAGRTETVTGGGVDGGGFDAGGLDGGVFDGGGSAGVGSEGVGVDAAIDGLESGFTAVLAPEQPARNPIKSSDKAKKSLISQIDQCITFQIGH